MSVGTYVCGCVYVCVGGWVGGCVCVGVGVVYGCVVYLCMYLNVSEYKCLCDVVFTYTQPSHQRYLECLSGASLLCKSSPTVLVNTLNALLNLALMLCKVL